MVVEDPGLVVRHVDVKSTASQAVTNTTVASSSFDTVVHHFNKPTFQSASSLESCI